MKNRNTTQVSLSFPTKVLAAGVVLASSFLPLSASAAQFSGIYSFGDSLTDTGNVYNGTFGQIPQSPPYADGRFSNGFIWVEYLSQQLGLQPTLFSEIPINPQGVNFAVGGAATGPNNALVPSSQTGLLSQVWAFANFNPQADPNALYTVWAGANDLIYVKPQDYGDINQTISTAVQNLTSALGFLGGLGAKNLMVFNLPDLGKLPVAQLGNRNPAVLSAATQAYNSALATALNGFSQNPGLNIISVDTYSLFNQAIASPASFGLTNVTDPCLDTINQTLCSNPNEYLFWDYSHPATGVHRVIAGAALAAIPEPSVLLGMFALGILTTTGVVKRKKPSSKVSNHLASRLKHQSTHVELRPTIYHN
ncbi:lipolytic enzyme [Richelia sinica FACHB-800]|uniref:Lipolytic enzyme n=1 Tax=Richelia sinica FACHB-800 TaxID=1357546 RepID=A0A975Y342_9NOST|nr:SGNH/GDSL hydrolase family protein [Richelia sinica]MBD2662911.1 SGNH/GDSL hydrolase family protein [Richelia sinica FACHB-800]QXE21751.1 lipolytic enzyme [Richelia sinica FACHB-800]